MLTVIIIRESSRDFINKYRTLFEPYLDSGQIAFCLWDEHGTTVQTALGNLFNIVKGVDKWRAIVALPLSSTEDRYSDEETNPDNPFDYICNYSNCPGVVESTIPLIRLAQMLGGVPGPGRHFRNSMSGNMLVVKREEDESYLREQNKKWNDICDKYSFIGDLPDSLYLFMAKAPQRIAVPVNSNEQSGKRHETDSSLFVERNRYPAKARFIMQECSKHGTVHYDEDLFCFWMTVLTLAINQFASGTFEAYKLYQMRANVNREEVRRVLSSYYNRLGGVLFFANQQIQLLGQSQGEEPDIYELPHLDVTIPVNFRTYEENDLFISSRRIGLSGDCPQIEELWWHEATHKSRTAMNKIISTIQIELDRACVNGAYLSTITTDEIRSLNSYQKAIMEEKLSEKERKILAFTSFKVFPLQRYKEETSSIEQEGSKAMRKRMTRRLTLLIAFISLFIYIIGFIPDFIYQYDLGFDIEAVMGIAGFGLLVMMISGLVCLFDMRSSIIRFIQSYNQSVRKITDNLHAAENHFSEYLSDCSTYMRSRMLLQKLDEKEQITQDGLLMLTEHNIQLSEQMKRIGEWLQDFNMSPIEDKGEFGNKIDFDFEVAPSQNRQYLIQLEKYELMVDGPDGSQYQIPYPFVSGIEISRIPVFEPKKA